jgi:hypothetical protein
MIYAAPGTAAKRIAQTCARKIVGDPAELSSYHHGALPGGRVENPLSQTQ